jgi:IclR family mhp operon transcriptional activator
MPALVESGDRGGRIDEKTERARYVASVTRYRHVRALERGLTLLAELNRQGRTTPLALARATGIDRTTVYRMLSTLEEMGYVMRMPSDEHYCLTRSVHQLSGGFREADWVSGVVHRELMVLLKEVLWPSDFASFESGAMVIRESTHSHSPFSIHRAMVGRPRPFVRSALGRAVLSAVSARERAAMLEMTVRTGQPDAEEAADKAHIAQIVRETRARGYSISVGGSEPNISGIALPLRGPLRIMGAISIIFFSSVLTPEEAADRYLDPLRRCLGRIEDELREQPFD